MLTCRRRTTPHVMVLSAEGYFYLYSIDLEKGGECTLMKQYKYVFSFSFSWCIFQSISCSLIYYVQFAGFGRRGRGYGGLGRRIGDTDRGGANGPATRPACLPAFAVRARSAAASRCSNARSVPPPPPPSPPVIIIIITTRHQPDNLHFPIAQRAPRARRMLFFPVFF